MLPWYGWLIIGVAIGAVVVVVLLIVLDKLLDLATR